MGNVDNHQEEHTPVEQLTWSRRRVLQAAGAGAGLAAPGGVTAAAQETGVGQEETSVSIPVLEVASRGVSQDQATALAQELDADAEFRVDEHGVLQFVDEEAYIPIPSAEVEPRDEAGEEDTAERDPSMAMDFDALAEMPEPPNADELGGEFLSALEATESLPAEPLEFEPNTSHAKIEVDDIEDGRVLERDLDTAVYVSASFEDVPLEGPGAKIRGRAADLGSGPVWSDVRHSFRQELEPGPEVELLSPNAVNDLYRTALERDTLTESAEEVELVEPRLVYLAPELRRTNVNPVGEGPNEVRALVPHYRVGATATFIGPDEEPVEVELLREFIPATTDGEFVPQIELEARGEGDQFGARVDIEGGQPPYEVLWSLGDHIAPLELADGAEFSGTIRPRESIEETTVTVDVIDANGVRVRDRRTIEVEAEGSSDFSIESKALRMVDRMAADVNDAPSVAATGRDGTPETRATAVPGPIDVGLQAALWPGWAGGFQNEANIAGVGVHNAWKGQSVWEIDFFSPKDNDWGVDTADLVFSSGHGAPPGWTVENTNHNGKWIWNTEADEDWGDHDLEWHALMSCNVLAPNDSNCGSCRGKSRTERWGQEFDGLHQFQGFQTLGYRVGGFPDAYGRYVFGNWLFPALPMMHSWFLAVDNYQPGFDPNQAWRRRGVVMYPVDARGRCTKDDFFHGEGPVGPDIPHDEVRGVCSVVAATGGG